MINLDGTQTVKDICEWLVMPEGAKVRIHYKDFPVVHLYTC